VYTVCNALIAFLGVTHLLNVEAGGPTRLWVGHYVGAPIGNTNGDISSGPIDKLQRGHDTRHTRVSLSCATF
jgi:hypothetical protein